MTAGTDSLSPATDLLGVFHTCGIAYACAHMHAISGKFEYALQSEGVIDSSSVIQLPQQSIYSITEKK